MEKKGIVGIANDMGKKLKGHPERRIGARKVTKWSREGLQIGVQLEEVVKKFHTLN